jgi:hypothetical protein
MNGTAQLVLRARGDVEFLAQAESVVEGTPGFARRAHVTGGDDLVFLDDDGAHQHFEASGTGGHHARDVEVVTVLFRPFHVHCPSLLQPSAQMQEAFPALQSVLRVW